MAHTIPVGAKGVDFSFNKPPPARLLELGYSFVVGYLSVPPSNPGKNLTADDCKMYLNAGLSVLLVWEMSATTPNQGAPRGATDGSAACRLARALGYPEDVPILAAVDTNTTVSLAPAHEGYVRAFAKACLPYPCGVYCDVDLWVLVRDVCKIGWIPNAWAWSAGSRKQMEERARSTGAHVLQRTGFYIDNKWAVDPNDVIAPFPAWSLQHTPPTPEKPPVVPPPVVAPKEELMFAGFMTNNEPRTADGATFPAGKFQYALIFDGEKVTKLRQMVSVSDDSATDPRFSKQSNATIDGIPDFAGMKGVTAVLPPIKFPTYGPVGP